MPTVWSVCACIRSGIAFLNTLDVFWLILQQKKNFWTIPLTEEDCLFKVTAILCFHSSTLSPKLSPLPATLAVWTVWHKQQKASRSSFSVWFCLFTIFLGSTESHIVIQNAQHWLNFHEHANMCKSNPLFECTLPAALYCPLKKIQLHISITKLPGFLTSDDFCCPHRSKYWQWASLEVKVL